MIELGNVVTQLAIISIQDPPMKNDSELDCELEELSKVPPSKQSKAINDGAGTSSDEVLAQEINPSVIDLTKQKAGDCCIWKACRNCDILKSEKLILETTHFEEIKEMENKNDSVIHELNKLKEGNAVVEKEKDELNIVDCR